MHEQVFVEAILRELGDPRGVSAITVEVGELAEIPANDLGHALRARLPCRVQVIEKAGKIACGCGFQGRPKMLVKAHDVTLFACPACGGSPRVLEGKDIILKEKVVKEHVPGGPRQG